MYTGQEVYKLKLIINGWGSCMVSFELGNSCLESVAWEQTS